MGYKKFVSPTKINRDLSDEEIDKLIQECITMRDGCDGNALCGGTVSYPKDCPEREKINKQIVELKRRKKCTSAHVN